MRIPKVYADAQGESHFGEMEVELPQDFLHGTLSLPLPVTAMYLREAPAQFDAEYHNAPRRQFIVNLKGGLIITTSDGEERAFGPGDLFYVEDVTGKGHLSRALDDTPRQTLFIAVD